MSIAGMLGGLAARLTDAPESRDARSLADRVRSSGSDRIADVTRGEKVTLAGRVRSVVAAGGPDHLGVTAELFDGTGAVEVCWLGRHTLPGIDTGRHLRVTGRVGVRSGVPTMFNPRYELLAGPPGRAVEEKNA